MSVVNFRRVGSRIVGFVNGQMLNKDFGNVDDARNVEEMLRQYKAELTDGYINDAEELWEKIETEFSPFRRIARGNLLEADESGNVYLKGSKIPMPRDLAETILEAANESSDALNAYVNFWKLSMLNPSTTARDSFFRYVDGSGVVITDNGYVLLYKAVTHKELHDASVDLARFVAEKFVSIAMKGESPEEYVVIDGENGYEIRKYAEYEGGYVEFISTLMQDLTRRTGQFQEIGESETLYTDKHTCEMDIRLGVQAWKDRSECDPDINRECSHGLHVGSFEYVSRFGHGDDTILLCLVNPKDVVAVPAYDRTKLRVCRYLPIGIMEKDAQGNWKAIEQTHFELDYIDYEADELQMQFDEIEARLTSGGAMLQPTFDLLVEQREIISQRLSELSPQLTGKPLERAQAPSDSLATVNTSNDDDFDDFDDDDGDSW